MGCFMAEIPQANQYFTNKQTNGEYQSSWKPVDENPTASSLPL